MEPRLMDVLQGKEDNYILPFFWQHGESKELLEEGMQRIYDSGIKAVCVESRPHPDFVGEGWWRDLDIIMAKAKELNMRVWVLDDAHFPSGFCNGKIAPDSPYGKVYLTQYGVDIVGPKQGRSVLIILEQGEELVAVTMGKRDRNNQDSLTEVKDLTSQVSDGRVFVDVPNGLWCVNVIKTTRKGTGRKNYINTIDHDAVRYFIDQIYEPHYAHYKDDFGKTFAGFFSDEPEIGSFGGEYGHDANIGKFNMKMPWSQTLHERLKELWGSEFAENLMALWTTPDRNSNENKSGLCRMQFADIAARLYGENFCEQIGDWCRQHGVEYIGHVIEDGGMHAHMGIGAGHYFHALWGQDMAGIDVVLQQIRPGLDDCKFHSVGGNLGYHGELYHYALAKLAASLAHMDSKKKGRALCEVFGAYGWAEGLKLMKWLLDHMLVNGINYFVPHAFSMKDFPDPDCPPHFYARGMNPQFPYFKNLMEYCNRVSHLISNGVHIPAVAVVYPAEQEWAGEYLPVEAIGKQLLRNQIDYEILPTDVLLTMTVVEGKLKWENEQVPVLILSGSRCITKMLADWLCKAAEKGLKIVVVGQKPLAMDNNGILREWTSQIKDNLTICEQEDLADILYSFGVDEIKTKKYENKKFYIAAHRSVGNWQLRYYHYKHQNGEFWLFMNQSETEEINTSLCFEDGMMDSHKIDKECSCWYQAWENTVEPCEWDENNDLSLQLVPGEMKVLYMGDCTPYAKILAEKQEIMKLKKATDSQTGKIEIVPDAWKLCIKETGTEKYVLQEREKTGDFCRKHPYFCGVMRYETTVFLPKIKSCELNLGEVYETAHVLVNEKEAGVRVALPYSFEIGKLLHEGENRIIVEVVNTLANRQRDFFSMTMPIEPSGLIGPVTLDYF